MTPRHLLSSGHRRIAVLSDLVSIETAGWIAGVTRALSEVGVELDHQLVRPDLRTIDVADEVVTGLLGRADPHTGVVALRNILSIGALRAPRTSGERERVGLGGFDDFPPADLMGLTVIR